MSAADYFTKTALVAQTLARASAVNTNLTAIETGFGRLPDRIITDTGRITFAVTGGAADVYTLSLHKTPAAYYNGMVLDIEVHATNTGACTIDVDSLGAKSIKGSNGTDPAAGDLTAGEYHTLRYDDTNGYFRITSMVQSVINGQAAMSDAAIKTAYENNADTNAFTDAQQTKVNYLTVTGAIDLDPVKTKTDYLTLTGAVNLDTINTRTDVTLGTSEASKFVSADANGNVQVAEELQAKCYTEKVVALSGTTPSVDCSTGNVFTLTTSGNTTFTFDYSSVQLTTNDAYAMLLRITSGGSHSLTYPASVKWPLGTKPDDPASGETDTVVCYTVDGGTTWTCVRSVDDEG